LKKNNNQHHKASHGKCNETESPGQLPERPRRSRLWGPRWVDVSGNGQGDEDDAALSRDVLGAVGGVGEMRGEGVATAKAALLLTDRQTLLADLPRLPLSAATVHWDPDTLILVPEEVLVDEEPLEVLEVPAEGQRPWTWSTCQGGTALA